ncbi:hypothetical protein GCM10018785_67270 [Streptomyces longispororuber]|uniref:Uncharacterized protein n=1 Tax=Streptomyces longispororuber TaxID=68230 RepID=A0A919DYB6_9ACTN|nr:hypothetical protein GCM10018785_67270 [Streptomyces longispororuber]
MTGGSGTAEASQGRSRPDSGRNDSFQRDIARREKGPCAGDLPLGVGERPVGARWAGLAVGRW